MARVRYNPLGNSLQAEIDGLEPGCQRYCYLIQKITDPFLLTAQDKFPHMATKTTSKSPQTILNKVLYEVQIIMQNVAQVIKSEANYWKMILAD